MKNELLKLENVRVESLCDSTLISRGLEIVNAKVSQNNIYLQGLKKVGELLKHVGPVYSLSISPDSEYIVSAGEDRLIRLWSLPNFSLLNELDGHDSQIFSLEFSPDNRTVISGGWDKTVKVWDLPTGKCLMTLRGHQRAVNQVSISPDGLSAAVACADKRIYVWDLVSGVLAGILNGHQGAVLSVVYSTSGDKIISSSDDQTIWIWNAHSFSGISIINLKPSRPSNLSLFDDNYLIVSYGGTDQGIRKINLLTNESLDFKNCHSRTIRAISVIAGKNSLISGGEDSKLNLWSIKDEIEQKESIQLSSWLWSVSSSPDGRYIIAGLGSGAIEIYQTLPEI